MLPICGNDAVVGFIRRMTDENKLQKSTKLIDRETLYVASKTLREKHNRDINGLPERNL